MPVRTLVGQSPVENVPASVGEAAKNAYRRIPTPLPPSIEPHRIDLSRFRVPTFAAAGTIAVVAVGIVLVAGRDQGGDPSQADRVAKLVDAPVAVNLLATPSIVTPEIKTASLANNGPSTMTWNATASASWIRLTPNSGNLQPAQSISIAVDAELPTTGPTDGTITITGSDGSRQTLKFRPTG
jgi:hypothetical protein